MSAESNLCVKKKTPTAQSQWLETCFVLPFSDPEPYHLYSFVFILLLYSRQALFAFLVCSLFWCFTKRPFSGIIIVFFHVFFSRLLVAFNQGTA